MRETGRELTLEDLPSPPLFKLVDPEGKDVFQETEVGGEGAKVCALFSDRELAGEFSAGAAVHGMENLFGLNPRELSEWGSVEVFALSGADFVLVVSERGAGLFHAGDVAQKAEEMAGEIPFPLYMISDERGEAPLIMIEVEEGEVLVAALFSSPENARDFRERASHLDLPDSLGTIEDRDGLRRHALIAREAGDLRSHRSRIRPHRSDPRRGVVRTLKPTLCTDVDSTVWDTGAWICSAVLDVTGETLDMDRITTWTHVLDTYGEETTTAIF